LHLLQDVGGLGGPDEWLGRLGVLGEGVSDRREQFGHTAADPPPTRRLRWSVRSRKQRATLVVHAALVGVKGRWKRGGLLVPPGVHVGVLVGGVGSSEQGPCLASGQLLVKPPPERPPVFRGVRLPPVAADRASAGGQRSPQGGGAVAPVPWRLCRGVWPRLAASGRVWPRLAASGRDPASRAGRAGCGPARAAGAARLRSRPGRARAGCGPSRGGRPAARHRADHG